MERAAAILDDVRRALCGLAPGLFPRIEEDENGVDMYRGYYKSRWGKARRHLYEAFGLELAPHIHLNEAFGLELSALRALTAVHLRLRRPQEAFGCAQRILAVAREMERPGAESIALSKMGRLCDQLGAQQPAFQYFQEALRVARTSGDSMAEQVALGGLANFYERLGESEQAREYRIARASCDAPLKEPEDTDLFAWG